MNKTRLTLRITQGQDAIIKQLAARDGVSRYQAGLRLLEVGLAERISSGATTDNGITDHLGEIAAQLERLASLTDRVLFVSSSAYIFSRRAVMKSESDPSKIDQALSEAVAEAYRRQLALVRQAT